MLCASVDLEGKVSAGGRKCFAVVNNLVSRYKVELYELEVWLYIACLPYLLNPLRVQSRFTS
jgi:hypothetical protein